jgi:hypothetical protein
MVTLGNAASHLKIHSLIVERSARDKLADDRFPFGIGMRIPHSDAIEAALQASEMLSQAIGLSLVDGDQFIYAVAIDEAAIEHGDFRVFERQKAAIEIYGHERVSGWMEMVC